MDDFLIWDMEINKPVVKATIKDYISVNFKDRCKAFKDIGIKDINGKSIYADCSIVEFDFNYMNRPIKLKGYFSFNQKELYYDLIVGSEKMPYNSELVSNIKIIDTIQENKLGLIK